MVLLAVMRLKPRCSSSPWISCLLPASRASRNPPADRDTDSSLLAALAPAGCRTHLGSCSLCCVSTQKPTSMPRPGLLPEKNPLPGAVRSRHGKCSCCSDGDLKTGGKQLEDHCGLNTVRRRRRNSSSGCYLLGVSVRTCTRWAVQEHSGGGGKSTQGLFVW